MTTEQKLAIKKFAEELEECQAPRYLADFASLLVPTFDPQFPMEEYDKFLAEEFRRYLITNL